MFGILSAKHILMTNEQRNNNEAIITRGHLHHCRLLKQSIHFLTKTQNESCFSLMDSSLPSSSPYVQQNDQWSLTKTFIRPCRVRIAPSLSLFYGCVHLMKFSLF